MQEYNCDKIVNKWFDFMKEVCNNEKIIKYICHPKDTLVCMMNKNFFFFVPDKIYLKWKYRLIIGKKLDLKILNC